MAGIATTMSITDKMLGPLQRINAQLNNVKAAFDRVDTASEAAFSPEEVEDLRGSIAAMQNDINQVAGSMNDVDDAIESASRSGSGLEGALKKVLTVATAIASVKFAQDWISGSMELADAQGRAEVQLNNVLNNMGAQAGGLDILKQKAAALQKTSIYGDEAYIAGAAELATYTGDVQALMVLMDTLSDFATGMSSGTALDVSGMTDMATQLGKVMNGTFDGIAKKGFTLTDVQKEIIKNGTDMEKALTISDIIAENWDGLAEAIAATPYGQIEQFKNSWGDFREEIGERVYPIVAELFDKIEQHMPQIQKLIEGMVSLLGPVVDVLGVVIDLVADYGDVILVAAGAWVAFKVATEGATWAMNGFNAVLTLIDAHPILAILSAILGLVTAIKDLWNNCEEFRGWIIDALQSILNAGYDMTKKLTAAVADMWDTIKPILDVVSSFAFGLKPAIDAIDINVKDPNKVEEAYNTIIDTMEGWRNPVEEVAAEDMDNYLSSIPDVSSYTEETAGNTASLANASEATIKYLKDIAEREAINKFTTAEVKIDLGGVSNTVSNNMDIDGFVDYLATTTAEALSVTAAKSAII